MSILEKKVQFYFVPLRQFSGVAVNFSYTYTTKSEAGVVCFVVCWVFFPNRIEKACFK